MWVEAVCPYLSISEAQAFRQCSKGCRSLIRLALPFCIEVLEPIVLQLQASPLVQEEEEEYKASETQRLITLQNNIASLDSLTKADIDDLRRMKSAPIPILEAGKALNSLLGYPNADNPFSLWGTDHLNRLKSYDRSNVTKKEYQALDRFMLKYSEEEVGNAGKSCVGLYRFLKAIWLLSTPAPSKPSGIREDIQRVQRTLEVYKRLAEK
jgi:hypothetical protein